MPTLALYSQVTAQSAFSSKVPKVAKILTIRDEAQEVDKMARSTNGIYTLALSSWV